MSCFVTSDLAMGEYKQPVNLDIMVTFEPFENLNAQEKNGRYQIQFKRDESGTGPGTIFWKYTQKTDRDCDLGRLLERFTQTLK